MARTVRALLLVLLVGCIVPGGSSDPCCDPDPFEFEDDADCAGHWHLGADPER